MVPEQTERAETASSEQTVEPEDDDGKFLFVPPPKGEWGDGDIQSYKGEEVEEYPCVYLDSNGLYDFGHLRDLSMDYKARSDFTDP